MEIQLTSILFQIINFGVVLGTLVFLLYRPILKLFEERSKRIAEGQKAAETAIKEKEKVAQLKAETKKKLEQETTKIMEQAVSEAEAEKQRIIEQAQEQAEQWLKENQKKWLEEKEKLKKQLYAQLADAVIKVSEKVLGEVLTLKKHQNLIDKELNKILKEI